MSTDPHRDTARPDASSGSETPPASALVPVGDPHPGERHDGWTPSRQVAFLRELAATHNVAAAARAVGMSRQSAYKLRARLRGEPFDMAWAEAFQCSFDALAEAAMDRALNGVEVQHYYHGELVGTSRRYDARLTLGLLALRDAVRPIPQAMGHPSLAYDPGEFEGLLARVEQGPETWEEEQAAERDARLAYYSDEEDEYEGEEDCDDELDDADD